jgi:3,4-dihydroxy-2-butanone 4-phosphate synthase
MDMIFKAEKLTHESLLFIMPFGAGYTCEENGEPSRNAVFVACALHATQYLLNPHAVYTEPLEN